MYALWFSFLYMSYGEFEILGYFTCGEEIKYITSINFRECLVSTLVEFGPNYSQLPTLCLDVRNILEKEINQIILFCFIF